LEYRGNDLSQRIMAIVEQLRQGRASYSIVQVEHVPHSGGRRREARERRERERERERERTCYEPFALHKHRRRSGNMLGSSQRSRSAAHRVKSRGRNVSKHKCIFC
jgi:hypothetical protein